jgi:hypothetical protein
MPLFNAIRQLARDARLPVWVLADCHAMVPSRYSMRLWELIEHAPEDPAPNDADLRSQPQGLELQLP